nr:MAG TPA: hypothetical protein [Caudoviricetes sp.]
MVICPCLSFGIYVDPPLCYFNVLPVVLKESLVIYYRSEVIIRRFIKYESHSSLCV